MRRSSLLAYAFITCLSLAPASAALAQMGGGAGGGGGGGAGGRGGGSMDPGAGADSGKDDAERKKRDEEWGGGSNLDLPGKRNAGPCPYVKVLYDAARYIEFKDSKIASTAVGYTGEIQNLSSGCSYQTAAAGKPTQPIHVEAELLFAFGRGPQARDASHVYRYWIAVTDRNLGVVAKDYFDIDAKFPAGEDRVMVTDRVNNIDIPRAADSVSGSNFEILIGFDVTPEMAAFNRDGKRFRVNAGGVTTTASAAAPRQ